MKLLAGFLAVGLCLSLPLARAQTASPAPTQTAPAASRQLPTFSGTWLLNLTRSQIDGGRPEGSSVTIIDYDGKTWNCIQKHLNRRGQAEATSQTKLLVGSPILHVEKQEPFTFRSRIFRQAQALVLVEYIRTYRGERFKNTMRYTLEDAGNTLIEDEKSAGPLGTQTTRWVWERQGTGENTSPSNKEGK